MKLLTFPLFMIIFVAIVSMLMGGSLAANQEFYQQSEGQGFNALYFYDEGGNPVCYQNGTAYYAGDDGYISWHETWFDAKPYWANSTAAYRLYETPYASDYLPREMNFDINSSIGLIAAISVTMFIVSFVGIRIFGNGLSENSVSTIIKGSLLITLWLIFSGLALAFLMQIPASLGGIFYFGLTAMYTVGIVKQVG